MESNGFSSRMMLKIFHLLFETRTGRLALRAYALVLLSAVAALAGAMTVEAITSFLLLAMLFIQLTALKTISVHRGRLSTRTHEFLPFVHRAADLVFDLLTLPSRTYAAPARARPRPAAARLGRLPAVTLAPRLLPIPFATRA